MSDDPSSRQTFARPGRPRARNDVLITGRLVAHGTANYQFRADQDPSYYVKLLSTRGERVLWGKDLERAIKASQTRVQTGDVVGARRVGHETVTVTERRLNAQGRVIAQSEQLAHRNRWVVEKANFFAERARLARQLRDQQLDARAAVRERPELKSTFLTLRAAEEYAQRITSDPRERARFVEMVKGAMAGSIRKGEPLPTIRMRQKPKAIETTPSHLATRARKDEPTR